MEILFENKYSRDKEWAKDIFGYLNIRRPLTIVLDVFFSLYLVAGIYRLVADKVVEFGFFIAPLLWVALMLYIYNKNVRVTLKRDLEIHGKPIEIAVTVTDEIIRQTQSTGSEFQLNYIDIKRVVITKKYIYLWSKANLLYSLKKDAFLVGSSEEFLAFLKSKGVMVR